MKCETCERPASPERTSEFVIADNYVSNRYRQGNIFVVEHAYGNVQEITLGLCDECFWPAFRRAKEKEAKVTAKAVAVILLITTLVMIPASIGLKGKWWIGALVLAAVWGVFISAILASRKEIMFADKKDEKQAKRNLSSTLWPLALVQMRALGCNELFTPETWQEKQQKLLRTKKLS